MTTLNLQVEASTDDCRRRVTPPDFSLTNTQNYCGDYDAATYDYGAGTRFNSVTIGQGDTIDAAVMQFRASTAWPTIPTTNINGEDADDAATFVDAADFDGRDRTDASVPWTPAAWVPDTWYTSSEIKTVIQEIVDRGGWESGNDLVTFWYHQTGGQGLGLLIAADSFDGAEADAPKLDIDYTAGGPAEYQKSFGETASMSTAFAKGLTLGAAVFAETHSHSESVVKTMFNPFAETASLAETLVRLPGKVFSETASLAEGLAPATTFRRALAETMSMAESLVRLPGKVFSETADMSEAVVRGVGLGISETANVAEALAKKMFLSFTEALGKAGKVFEEAMSLAEGFAVKVGVSLGESMNMAEAIVRGIGQQIAETANLVESFAPAATFRKVLAETKSLAETLSRRLALSQVFAEATSLAESLVHVPGKAFAEATSLAEALVRKITRTITETASMTESLARGRFKSFAETLSGLVEALGTVFVPGGGPPAVLRKLAYYAISLLPSRTRRRGRK